MKLWFVQTRANSVILTDAFVATKALQFADALGINTPDKKEFAASDGWLQRFKQRHNIKSYRLHGEASSAPVQDLDAFRRELREVTKKYNKNNIFNCDETGLFFRMAPNKTLAQAPEHGYKKDKARITILLTCNATGEC